MSNFREVVGFRPFLEVRKISNFAVLRKHLRNFAKYIIAFIFANLNISRNKLYTWNLQITHFKMIYDMFVFQEFEIFRTSKNSLNSDCFAKIAHKIAKSKYFPNILNDSDSRINSLLDDI